MTAVDVLLQPSFLLSAYLFLHLLTGFALPYLPYRGRGAPHLFVLFESVGKEFERRLNRSTRPPGVRLIRGLIVAVLLGIPAYGAGYVVSLLMANPYGWVPTFALFFLCIEFVAPLQLMHMVARHLKNNELPQAIVLLQPDVREQMKDADLHTLVRRAIEFIALSLNRFLLAPVFWFLIAGVKGMLLYTTYAALCHAFGWRGPFGQAVRVVYALLNIVPSFLTALLLSASALFAGGSNPLRALSTLPRNAASGLVIAAMAGALGVTLGGPGRLTPDHVEERPWVGPAGSSARLEAGDLARATLLQYVFFLSFLAIVTSFIFLKM